MAMVDYSGVSLAAMAADAPLCFCELGHGWVGGGFSLGGGTFITGVASTLSKVKRFNVCSTKLAPG